MSVDNQLAFQQLERIGRDHLELWCSEQASFNSLDAYEALRDFFGYGFLRNRSDILAGKYIKIAKEALDEISLMSEDPKIRVQHLAEKGLQLENNFKNKVNLKYAHTEAKGIHPLDLKFVRSICDDFIPNLKECNYHVRELCCEYFKKGNLKELFKLFNSIKGGRYKIASLYLRDMLFLYEKTASEKEKLSHKLTSEEVFLIYPIDTWVKKISEKLVGKTGDGNETAKLLIDKCSELGVSAAYLNHGIWYIGAKSIDFLLGNLDQIKGLKVKTL